MSLIVLPFSLEVFIGAGSTSRKKANYERVKTAIVGAIQEILSSAVDYGVSGQGTRSQREGCEPGNLCVLQQGSNVATLLYTTTYIQLVPRIT